MSAAETINYSTSFSYDDEAIRIGVITNIRAGQNSRRSPEALRSVVGPNGMVRAFGMPGDLVEIVGEFQEAGVNAVAINGGDGTVGAVLTEIFHSWVGPKPLLIPLCGGSLNSTARALGQSNGVDASVQLGNVVRRLESGGRGLTTRELAVLGGDDARRARRAYGFLFGCGLVYDYVDRIESLGNTGTLNSLLGSLMMTGQAVLNAGAAKQVFADKPAEVEVDGRVEQVESFKTAVACSAIMLPPSICPLPSNIADADGQFVYLVNGMERGDLLRNLFPILRGTYQGSQHRTGTARTLSVRSSGGYILDGERFPMDETSKVAVSTCGTMTFLLPE